MLGVWGGVGKFETKGVYLMNVWVWDMERGGEDYIRERGVYGVNLLGET